MISGFRRDLDEICALRGYYASLSAISVLTLRDDISVRLSMVKKSRSLLGFLDPWRWDRYVVPKRRYRNTTQRCVMSQKGADLTTCILVEIYGPFGGMYCLYLYFHPKDGSSLFLRNARKIPPDYTASHPSYSNLQNHRPKNINLPVCLL